MKAAKLLYNRYNFGPSVHCSYYSCVQYMLHVFETKLHLDHDKLKSAWEEWRMKDPDASKKSDVSQHGYYINLMSEQLRNFDSTDQETFYNLITFLRRKRNKADYKNKMIIPSEAKECVNSADKTLTIFNKHFKP